MAGSVTTRYVLDGPQVIEEFDGAGNWAASYVYEDGIDQPRCMDRADIADVDGDLNTAEVFRFHYHQNALGSVYEMTDPTGAVVEWVTYDVYGAATVRNQVGTVVGSSAVGNPYLYTGREYDPESGKYSYRARTYDPIAGRFLQRDPLGYVDGFGLHEYVRSSPSSWVDPLGTEGKKELNPLLKPLSEQASRDFEKLMEDMVNAARRHAEKHGAPLVARPSLLGLGREPGDLLEERSKVARDSWMEAWQFVRNAVERNRFAVALNSATHAPSS